MRYVEMLTDADIELGTRLWHALRGNKSFPVQGVFWLLDGDPGDWSLVVASPIVDELGPRDAYQKFAEITRDIPADSSQLLKITLVSPRDPVYQALRSTFGQTRPVEGTRLSNTNAAGIYIDDAYLYEVR